MNFTSSFASNLSTYNRRDYRRFLYAHLQYLQGLCQHSIQGVNDSIQQFLSSLFITSELVSEKDFHSRLNSAIEQRKQNTPKKFSNLFFLIRSINHRNAFVSTYETNYQYISSWYQNDDFSPYIPTEAVVYDNGCSCALQPNCTTQAVFFKENSSPIAIQGLKMGCTPSESLHASTLECFYNQSCLDLLQQYASSTYRMNPLSVETSQFFPNTAVSELIDNLFVEQWNASISYPSYYQQCLPSLCSYTYTQKFSVLYIIALLLGLQGGLLIVLRWISPKIIRIIMKIHVRRREHVNSIHPECASTTNSSPENISTEWIF